jgi:putative membrane protein
MRLLVRWLINAVSLWIVTRIVPGIYVRDFFTAMVAALVIGLLNATIGIFLKIITFPLTVLTLGIFLIVINALMLELASAIIRGFSVRNLGSAFIGAILLSIVSSLLHWLVSDEASRYR